ncbi:hypothetical protein PVA38_11715 [Streptococcus pneumoniae D39]|nr:hypothetical protein PVA38_11715 [Streptococcus pneumoniae D39]
MRSLIAVSYTHLRAHETVLDLVCRLLLEKKKKRINKTYHVLQTCGVRSLRTRIHTSSVVARFK